MTALPASYSEALQDIRAVSSSRTSPDGKELSGLTQKEHWTDIECNVGQLAEVVVHACIYPLGLVLAACFKGWITVHNSLVQPFTIQGREVSERTSGLLALLWAMLHALATWSLTVLWVQSLYERFILDRAVAVDADWWNSVDHELVAAVCILCMARLPVIVRFAYMQPEAYRVYDEVRLPREVLADDLLLEGWAHLPHRVIRSVIRSAAAGTQVDSYPPLFTLRRDKYRELLASLSDSSLLLLSAMLQEKERRPAAVVDPLSSAVSGGSVSGDDDKGSDAASVNSTDAHHTGPVPSRAQGYAASAVVPVTGPSVLEWDSGPSSAPRAASHTSNAGGGQSKAEDHLGVVADDAASSASSETVRLPVDVLCAAIVAHAGCMYQPKFRQECACSLLGGLLVAAVPTIIRSAWGLPILGPGLSSGAIVLLTAVNNAVGLTYLLLHLQMGPIDLGRRQAALQVLYNLASAQRRRRTSSPASYTVTPSQRAFVLTRLFARRERARPGRGQPSFYKDEEFKTETPVLNLETAENVHAWSTARAILLNVGPRYLRQILVLNSLALACAVIVGAVIISRVLVAQLPAGPAAAGGTQALVGELITAIFMLVVYAVLGLYTVDMLLSGAAANASAAAHSSLLVRQQTALTRAQAADRDAARQWEGAIQMLECARQSIACEEPLTLFGLSFSYGLAQSVLYAFVTASVVVLELLNDKFKWINLAGTR